MSIQRGDRRAVCLKTGTGRGRGRHRAAWMEALEPRCVLANTAPVAEPDSYFIAGGVLEVPAERGVLVNDRDAESSPLTALLIEGSTQGGTAELRSDGSFRFTPTAGFAGWAQFSYRASDGTDLSEPALARIAVGMSPVKIHEIMAANVTGPKTRVRASSTATYTGVSQSPDWIELHNSGDIPFHLGGYALTDNPDEAAKWAFPTGTQVPAGGYLVVYADRLNVTDPQLDETGRLHTNFNLSVSGEYLALFAPNGQPMDSLGDGYPEQRPDVSYGRASDGVLGHLQAPTLGEANSGRYAGMVADTKFDRDRGYYQQPINVAISVPTAGAVIRYTLDGSAPTASNGQVYASPIPVQTTTVIKAAAFKDGYLPSTIDSHTYVFATDVLKQTGAGLNAVNWGHKGPDWAMDPLVVNHENPEVRPELADFTRIPTVSVSMNFEEMFGAKGIYIAGEDIQKQISFEYFDPNRPDNGAQTNSTIQIVGGSSPQRWKTDKLSMRVSFTEDVGESELVYPVFGSGAALAFDTLTLDARLNNVWTYGGGSGGDSQRAIADYLRDEYAADLQTSLGGVATHSQHIHLYINGIYWGLHALHERPDENFAETYMGGIAEQWDIIKHNVNGVVNGTNASYKLLATTLGTTGNLTDEKYLTATQLLDIDDFIEYMLVNYYGGNSDWDHQNWYASHSPLDGKWRFHSWDAEKVLQGVNDDVTGLNNASSPTTFHRRLMTHPEYKLRFADLVQKHMYHGGALTPAKAGALYQGRADMINQAIRLESARWGDNQIDSGTKTRYTRLNWLNNVNGLLTNYFPKRTDIVVNQFVKRTWFATGQAPTFQVNGSDQFGGTVATGSKLTMAAPEGTIYFSTDGSDPRVAGGEVAPGARAYDGEVTLEASTRVQARLKRADGSWGPLSDAVFTTSVPATSDNLRISEIQYHPADPSDAERAAGFVDDGAFEYLELVNIGTAPIDLRNVRLEQATLGAGVEGVRFAFVDGRIQELAPGGRVIVVNDEAGFEARYGKNRPMAGVWDGGLGNGGERVILKAGNTTLADFVYSDQWVPDTDGRGPSLQAAQEAGTLANWQLALGWRASRSVLGSPGLADGLGPGDANGDGLFDSLDLVLVFQAGKYEDAVPNNATWAEGDWNGDGDFNSGDLIVAFQAGTYTTAASPAAAPPAPAALAALEAAIADDRDWLAEFAAWQDGRADEDDAEADWPV